jgi:hypothetical protein
MVTLFALGFYLGEPGEVTAFCDDPRQLAISIGCVSPAFTGAAPGRRTHLPAGRLRRA